MYMMKRIVQGIVFALALTGLVLGCNEGYKGIQWIRASHAKAQAAFDFLATPVGQTKDGKTIVRGDIVDVLIQQELSKLKGS